MFTMTQTPHEVKLYSEQGELLIETSLDSINVGYDSPMDTAHGSFNIPTVDTINHVKDDGIGVQVKRRSGILSVKQLTRRLLRNAYDTKVLTPDSLIWNDKGVVKKARWYYLGTFFPNPTSGT